MSTKPKNIELYKKEFGLNLKRIRESKNITQFDLATAMNNLASDSLIERTTISRIENGRTNVTLTTIAKLASALEIDIKELFEQQIH